MREIHVYPEGNMQVIELGRRGESLERCVVFHLEDWPEGVVFLLHRRREDPSPYPCSLERDKDGVARWLVTSIETAQAGSGSAELRIIHNSQMVKSQHFFTVVNEALTGENPDTAFAATAQWLDSVLLAAAKIREGGCCCEETTATDEEFGEMLDEAIPAGSSGGGSSDDDTATDEEFNDLLDDVFG